MPIDFPDNPTTGDTFTSNGRTWEWDGSRWNAVVSPLITEDSILTKTVRTVSADTSLVADDVHQVIRFTGTDQQVLTVDNVLSPGQSVQVIQDNTGQIEFSSGTGVTLLSDSGEFGSNGQNKRIEIFCAADGEYRLYGDLVAVVTGFDVEYLAIAGGGGGGGQSLAGAGGGGAGGYRSSVNGELSGEGSSAETPLVVDIGTNYTVTVGAGGSINSSGTNSVFSTVTSNGGGAGGTQDDAGSNGGSGGGGGGGTGGSSTQPGGSSTSNQGSAGGSGFSHPSATNASAGAGGGGANEVGQNGDSNTGGGGGDGIESNITGTLTYRAGGGGGGQSKQTPNGGTGGLGGGGGGAAGNILSPTNPSTAGATNTGGGGGGGSNDRQGSSGGSGIVILRYPSERTITIGAGLTGTTSTVGDNKVTEITAGTGNVSFA